MAAAAGAADAAGAAPTTFAGVLKAIKVADLPRVKNVVTVTSKETPVEGFQKLVDNHILSAPVLDEKTGSYTGFLDMRDLVSFVVFLDDEQEADIPVGDLHSLVGHGARSLSLPIEGVTTTYLSRRNPFHPVKETDTLFDVAQYLVKANVHRVPVVDDAGKLVNIVSQSSIAAELHKCVKACSAEAKKTVGELKLGTRPVVSVTKEQNAIEVFRMMDSKKLSGIAVVDEKGCLAGNTSGSDLKLFLKALSVSVVKKPIFQYLKDIRQDEVDIRIPTIVINDDESLALALGKLVSTRVHRLFIASDTNGFVPNGVVAISDILRHVLA